MMGGGGGVGGGGGGGTGAGVADLKINNQPQRMFCKVLLQATTALVSLQTKCVTENPL